MIEAVLDAAMLAFSVAHPEVGVEIAVEVQAAVSGHAISRTIVAGAVVGGQETCRGP